MPVKLNKLCHYTIIATFSCTQIHMQLYTIYMLAQADFKGIAKDLDESI